MRSVSDSWFNRIQRTDWSVLQVLKLKVNKHFRFFECRLCDFNIPVYVLNQDRTSPSDNDLIFPCLFSIATSVCIPRTIDRSPGQVRRRSPRYWRPVMPTWRQEISGRIFFYASVTLRANNDRAVPSEVVSYLVRI